MAENLGEGVAAIVVVQLVQAADVSDEYVEFAVTARDVCERLTVRGVEGRAVKREHGSS